MTTITDPVQFTLARLAAIENSGERAETAGYLIRETLKEVTLDSGRQYVFANRAVSRRNAA